MEHENWFEYKGNVLNLNNIEGFRVQKVQKADIAYTDISTQKGKKLWILHAGYTPLDSFKSKDEALQVARDIIAGKHKVKLRS